MTRRLPTVLALLLLTAARGALADPPPVVSPAGFRAALAAERGHALIVNLWASWCAPCRREIPELVRLEQDYGRCGLRVLGLALDEPAELATAVAPTVDRYFPAFRTLARDAASLDSFASVLDGAWNEVMPTSYVLAADGTVVRRIQGGKPYAEFAAAVTPLLRCPAS